MSNFTSPEMIQKSIATGQWKPNIYLTNLAIAYFQAEADYVADKLFPIVPVQLASSHYYKFSKEDLARDDMQRKPAFGKVAPALLGQTEDTYSCKVDQIIIGIDQLSTLNYTRTKAPGAADPRNAKVRAAVEKTKLHLDTLFADGFFKAGVWTNQQTGVTTTPGASQFYQFDDANSDPIRVVDGIITDIRKNGRRKPNKIGLGFETFNALKNHGDIIERVKYSGSTANPATINEQVLAQLFGVEKVVVLASTYNKAALGAAANMDFICDPKGMLVCYAPNSAAIDEPSAGYTFAWDMLGGSQYIAMSQWEGEKGTHAEFIEGLMAYDMKKTGDDLACYLTQCVK
jgi:hypothetical protein